MPISQHTHCLICLHGLGDTADNFGAITDVLALPNREQFNIIVPDAPIIPVTINGGRSMPAWYDILSLSEINREVDIDNIHAAVKRIDALIGEQIKKGIPAENIYLLGFSQGGVIASYTALLTKHALSKVFLLSTYLPAWEAFNPLIKNTNFIAYVMHGTYDDIVPHQAGIDLAKKLKAAGINAMFSDYPMAHSLCPQELADISELLEKI